MSAHTVTGSSGDDSRLGRRTPPPLPTFHTHTHTHMHTPAPTPRSSEVDHPGMYTTGERIVQAKVKAKLPWVARELPLASVHHPDGNRTSGLEASPLTQPPPQLLYRGSRVSAVRTKLLSESVVNKSERVRNFGARRRIDALGCGGGFRAGSREQVTGEPPRAAGRSFRDEE